MLCRLSYASNREARKTNKYTDHPPPRKRISNRRLNFPQNSLSPPFDTVSPPKVPSPRPAILIDRPSHNQLHANQLPVNEARSLSFGCVLRNRGFGFVGNFGTAADTPNRPAFREGD